MHGQSLIKSNEGDIIMGGVDGAFDINCKKGHVKVFITIFNIHISISIYCILILLTILYSL
jgi:hypothetical protein